jgi:hypothetical protein
MSVHIDVVVCLVLTSGFAESGWNIFGNGMRRDLTGFGRDQTTAAKLGSDTN